MTLSFTQTIGGKPNYFIEKIWESIIPFTGGTERERYLTFQQEHLSKLNKYWDGTGELWYQPVNPKYHTLLDDPHNRWRPAMDIHPVFAPLIKCKSIQKVEIKYLSIVPNEQVYPMVWIDGYLFYDLETGHNLGIEQLAINDGFDSVEDFFAYFNTSCTKKLIHWTDLKY